MASVNVLYHTVHYFMGNNMKRRNFGLSLISLLLMTQAPAFAQEKKEVCLVVPFPPGGGGDNLARSEVEYLSKNLGSTVWIANRPGAGGNIGTSSVVQAAPDGKTFGYVTNREGYTTIFVEDTGSGISEDAQKHIFERSTKKTALRRVPVWG